MKRLVVECVRPSHPIALLATCLFALVLVTFTATCGNDSSTPTPAADATPFATETLADAAPTQPVEASAPLTPTTEPAATRTSVQSGQIEGEVLRIHQLSYPNIVDPQQSSFTQEIAILLLNYEGLTTLDENRETIPAAAESWQYNSNATQITFRLRDGLVQITRLQMQVGEIDERPGGVELVIAFDEHCQRLLQCVDGLEVRAGHPLDAGEIGECHRDLARGVRALDRLGCTQDGACLLDDILGDIETTHARFDPAQAARGPPGARLGAHGAASSAAVSQRRSSW
jgi:hypothetical protein